MSYICSNYNIFKSMAKYNITPTKEKDAHYRSLVSPEYMDELQEKIMEIIVMKKKYLDKNYSAKQLALDLGTNTRYVSAVVNSRFHQNFTSFVNFYRINDAKTILSDRRRSKLTMQEVADMVGFANRQSFYGSFFRILGMTPREYKMKKLAMQRKK